MILFNIVWLTVSFLLGFGFGLAGAYLIFLPITALVPAALVKFARPRNLVWPTLLCYSLGIIATMVLLVVINTVISPPAPTGVWIICGLLFLVALGIAWAGWVRRAPAATPDLSPSKAIQRR